VTSESDNPRDRTYSRRSVLRTAEFAAAGGVIGTLATGTAAARADCALPEDYEYYSENDYEARDATTSYDESRYRKNYYEFVTRAIELRSGVTIADSWYDTYRGKYKSDHLVAGHVQTQEDDGDWDHYANIQKQTATVENLRPDGPRCSIRPREPADPAGNIETAPAAHRNDSVGVGRSKALNSIEHGRQRLRGGRLVEHAGKPVPEPRFYRLHHRVGGTDGSTTDDQRAFESVLGKCLVQLTGYPPSELNCPWFEIEHETLGVECHGIEA